MEQIQQWTEIKEKHRSSMWELKKHQLIQQQEVLKELLESAQSVKLKNQEAQHERYAFTIVHSLQMYCVILDIKLLFFREIKQLNQKQAKISIETTREVNNDKTLKSKTEKDSILREKKQTNMKKFMEDHRQLDSLLKKRKEDLQAELQREKQSVMKEIEEVGIIPFSSTGA